MASHPYTTRYALADREFVGPVIGTYDTWADAEHSVNGRADACVIVTAYESHGRTPLTWAKDANTSVLASGPYRAYTAQRSVGERQVQRWIAYLQAEDQSHLLASTDDRARALAACEAHAFDGETQLRAS
jgi:hypothetical protein